MIKESILNKIVSSHDELTYGLLKGFLSNKRSDEEKWEELGDDEPEEDDDDERKELGDDEDDDFEEDEIGEDDDDVDYYVKIRRM